MNEVLQNIGLSPEESEVYLYLLDKGAQTAIQIGKNTKVKRTYVYIVCKALSTKGLVKIEKQGKTTLFSPLSPDHLLTIASKQKEAASIAEAQIESSLEKLKEKYTNIDQRPSVTYFEGEAGLEKVFKDIYAPKSEPVYGCVDLDKADTVLPGHIVNKLIPLRIINKVEAISLLSDSELAKGVKARDKQSLRQSKLVDRKKYPLPAEIDVYEDKIAMLSFDKNKFVGILIQNKDIAESLKSIFKLAFNASSQKH